MKRIYDENKKLDMIFFERFGDNNGEMFTKNKLALLVELGELANEVKSFKYWSIKKPINERVLEEYADGLMLILMFMSTYNLDLHESRLSSIDINELFIKLFKLITDIEDNIVEVYSNYLLLGEMLGISKSEIEQAVLAKIEIAKQRLESEY